MKKIYSTILALSVAVGLIQAQDVVYPTPNYNGRMFITGGTVHVGNGTVLDHATIETAWAIESRHELPYADALILAAAQQQECRFVASDRWAHGRQIESLTVVDPFASSFDALDTIGAAA